MSLAVALSAVLLEKHKPETTTDMLVHNVKCSLQFALLVEKKRLFLSNLQVTSQYIAVIATNHAHATIGKILTETFPGFDLGKVFFYSLSHNR
jgi:hypothetical protein